MDEFWARSLHCALISKELCIYRNNKDDLDSMFICGLLHDIGQLVFYRRIPELSRQIGLLVEAGGITEIQAENKILGFNHYQTGAELARIWRLPKIIIETIKQHSDHDYTGIYADAASIIRTANHLCKMNTDNIDPNSFCNHIFAEDLVSIIDKAQAQFETIFKLFF